MDTPIISYTWSPWLNQIQSPWEKVLHLGVKRQFKKNSVVLGNAQRVNDLYYLYKGKIKVVSTTSLGREKPIWYISSGNIFGEVPFLDGDLCYNIFTCQEDCIVFTFSREVFSGKIIPQYPEVIKSVFGSMALKMRNLSAQINDVCLNSPKMRVYKMLYFLNPSNNGVLEVSQKELGDLLGIHRVTLNQILNDLKDKGIIEPQKCKKRFNVLDIEKLLDQIKLEEQEGE
ncbi:Crp/Fnr family transcriptional regulator [Desulfosporosinus sp. Sb-LF]|uniref:Crp/Fnr family transcriptional regulator n=1 Tax=Desulfosporosinus sp. Sb-LF TaxID=2560027 RepID=UPI00107FBCE9|nr:Crp/Fnr family transcriptional regulator [Desulfosporosinus sp. Sb-LF]TGE34367.1 Crp/Fnr family transcriptional regulator [Desulfosporosinus sp. Sb-LF]